jgi:chemotaxis protein MotA
MFATMDDPARIGPGMALALLTTLYGIILSSVIAGPIAGRLARLSEAELAWQRLAVERLELLAHAELETPRLHPRPNLRTVP